MHTFSKYLSINKKQNQISFIFFLNFILYAFSQENVKHTKKIANIVINFNLIKTK